MTFIYLKILIKCSPYSYTTFYVQQNTYAHAHKHTQTYIHTLEYSFDMTGLILE